MIIVSSDSADMLASSPTITSWPARCAGDIDRSRPSTQDAPGDVGDEGFGVGSTEDVPDEREVVGVTAAVPGDVVPADGPPGSPLHADRARALTVRTETVLIIALRLRARVRFVGIVRLEHEDDLGLSQPGHQEEGTRVALELEVAYEAGIVEPHTALLHRDSPDVVGTQPCS